MQGCYCDIFFVCTFQHVWKKHMGKHFSFSYACTKCFLGKIGPSCSGLKFCYNRNLLAFSIKANKKFVRNGLAMYSTIIQRLAGKAMWHLNEKWKEAEQVGTTAEVKVASRIAGALYQGWWQNMRSG